MPIGQFREQIDQIGVGFDAVDPAGTDQAGEGGGAACSVIVTGEQCISARHGRAADGVFDQVRVHIDMAVVQEQSEALLTPDHVGQRLSQLGFARDAGGLRSQPGEEVVDKR